MPEISTYCSRNQDSKSTGFPNYSAIRVMIRYVQGVWSHEKQELKCLHNVTVAPLAGWNLGTRASACSSTQACISSMYMDSYTATWLYGVGRTGETHLLRGSMVLVGLVRHTCYVALWCWWDW